MDYISKRDVLKVLENINLYVNKGEFVSIIGPSGCGKSTLFHIITKLEKAYEGLVEIDGEPLEKSNQRASYMHQKDLLMPWRTLIDNVILPLEIQGKNKREAKKEVKKYFDTFGLEGFEQAYPNELSGGMRQRAALLRTFLVDSELLLLDEPFGALDAINRSKMQEWLLDIWRQFKRSVLFITHDIEEAIYLSDRIYVLSQRPARVLKEVRISFERPRKKDIVVTESFLNYKKILMDALK
ncbi:ABC transporter ATP-binding protein [Crassaminicella indica]|uniref:ABC transporter ATP-binding protein n=2 Tax=Crassaminicella indica TaxID=2855394 RepID=A0ABX8RHP0_9CLOT|nr:ABC transporter ATP-binding protein [Crassaminicella indica]QXM07430.1 ABC transporter ATP-binding protein [Crassaminicella indica]